MLRICAVTLLLLSSNLAGAQHNQIDLIRHDAPTLAQYGKYDIGVRTIKVVDKDRIDVANTINGQENQYYHRSLTLEVWYPAALAADQSPGGQYQAMTRNATVFATLNGSAVRGATPLKGAERYPLVVISHGHPGNRFLLSHLGENLASKGFVVASIDHRDSTYDDFKSFTSTLYNRSLDQRFVIDSIAKLAANSSSFLSGLVDADRTGVVGYSMGGYGLLNNLGAGYNDLVAASSITSPNSLVSAHASGNANYRAGLDSRIKAGFAIAPWGMRLNFWRAEDLAGITVPTFYLAGDADNVSGYENGVRAIYQGAVNSDRYLLTFKNAGHSAGAPHPVPVEILNSSDKIGADHYSDPVWDNVRMNNIMDHFASAFFLHHLVGDTESISYLDVVPDGRDAIYSMRNGKAGSTHNYWKGFGKNGAVGLKLEHLKPGR
ncbi:MAG: putative dienelactone hydrolase [Paraglaciecola psychrophila]|jgi:predicted dienelactone hydrolase